ncbi:hypothetical protein BgiBS90_024115 [Biomphalaria glabrata]|nr:hypothetical protein BgiBS90_024115 [Biomphalaria glabrata]
MKCSVVSKRRVQHYHGGGLLKVMAVKLFEDYCQLEARECVPYELQLFPPHPPLLQPNHRQRTLSVQFKQDMKTFETLFSAQLSSQRYNNVG